MVTRIASAITATTLNKVGMLTSAVARPNRRLRMAKPMNGQQRKNDDLRGPPDHADAGEIHS